MVKADCRDMILRYVVRAEIHASAKGARAEPHSKEKLVIYPSAPQDNQYKISHFLASMEACNLIT